MPAAIAHTLHRNQQQKLFPDKVPDLQSEKIKDRGRSTLPDSSHVTLAVWKLSTA